MRRGRAGVSDGVVWSDTRRIRMRVVAGVEGEAMEQEAARHQLGLGRWCGYARSRGWAGLRRAGRERRDGAAKNASLDSRARRDGARASLSGVLELGVFVFPRGPGTWDGDPGEEEFDETVGVAGPGFHVVGRGGC